MPPLPPWGTDRIAEQFFFGFYGTRIIEPKASDTLSEQSTTELHPQPPQIFFLEHILDFEQISAYGPPASEVLSLQVYTFIPSCLRRFQI